jgi:hypothetical protein
MTELYTTALEVQQLCECQGWSFCIIGGGVERLEQKIREHARPFTTLPPPGRKS